MFRLINVNAQRTEEHEDGTFVLVQDPGMPEIKSDNIFDFIALLEADDKAKKLAAKLALYGDDYED